MVESHAVRLNDLFAGVQGWCAAGAPEADDIIALCYRSDQVRPGSLFFCVPGFKHDGHAYAADAVGRGAAALCVEHALDLPVAQALVPSVRSAMGPVAAAFHGHPSRRLLTAGITGTNGKTTSAFLAAHLLDHAGLRAGLMGTVERRIGGRSLPAGRTTPEAIDIQRDLAEMVEAGDRALVMEVSSHALHMDRVLGTQFEAIAFTNLSQDHLDYHHTLDAYFEAKRRLFVDDRLWKGHPYAVINVDDPHGRRMAGMYPRERVLGCSTSGSTGDYGPPDLEWTDYSIGPGGTRGSMVMRGTTLGPAGRVQDEVRVEASSPLLGDFNVANVLTAVGLGLALGLSIETMLEGLGDFRGVPGRMESVDVGQDFTVLVDYAHTPDSVRNVLRTARGFARGRLVALLGCGGDRDRGKRPLMGREAEEVADLVVITSDNPRSEDPLAIIADITEGLERPEKAVIEPDRRLAINKVMADAREGDVIMILGKGHESGQEFATRTIPFDDRQVAREALLALMKEGR